MAERLGGYDVVRRLGATRRELYLASDGVNERLLVVVSPDPAGARKARHELARCTQIKHRSLVRVHETFEHEGRMVLVFDHIAGVTLTQVGEHLEKQREVMADVAIWHLGHELAGALAEAHAASYIPLVHSRLVPDHVVVTWRGSVRLFGMGLTSVLRAGGGEEAWRAARFVAPEVRIGDEVSPKSNTYSLAAILWWLLTRQLPPAEGTPPKLATLRKDVPPGIAVAIDRALRPVPSDRDTDCRKLAALLQPLAQGGENELSWNMEIVRALTFMDDVPWSAALPPSSPTSSDPAAQLPRSPQRPDSLPPSPKPDEPKPKPFGRAERKTTLQSKLGDVDESKDEESIGDRDSQSVRGNVRAGASGAEIAVEVAPDRTGATEPPPGSDDESGWTPPATAPAGLLKLEDPEPPTPATPRTVTAPPVVEQAKITTVPTPTSKQPKPVPIVSFAPSAAEPSLPEGKPPLILSGAPSQADGEAPLAPRSSSTMPSPGAPPPSAPAAAPEALAAAERRPRRTLIYVACAAAAFAAGFWAALQWLASGP